MARHAFRSLTLIGALAACAALPDLANAGPLDAQDVFAHAAVQPKLILLALIAASPGAVLATAIKVAQRSKLEGGSGFVSALRFGGPIAGILGGAYGGASISLGLANLPGPATLKVVAPGLAEIALLITLGFAPGALQQR